MQGSEVEVLENTHNLPRLVVPGTKKMFTDGILPTQGFGCRLVDENGTAFFIGIRREIPGEVPTFLDLNCQRLQIVVVGRYEGKQVILFGRSFGVEQFTINGSGRQ